MESERVFGGLSYGQSHINWPKRGGGIALSGRGEICQHTEKDCRRSDDMAALASFAELVRSPAVEKSSLLNPATGLSSQPVK